MLPESDYVDLEVEVKASTEKALLADIDGKSHWIPLSVIDRDLSEVEVIGDCGVLYVKEWFARREGLV